MLKEGAEEGAEGEEPADVAQAQTNGAEADQEMAAADELQPAPAPVSGERQPNTERITTPYLTKYERARILGTRALQIRYTLLSSTIQVFIYAFSV